MVQPPKKGVLVPSWTCDIDWTGDKVCVLQVLDVVLTLITHFNSGDVLHGKWEVYTRTADSEHNIHMCTACMYVCICNTCTYTCVCYFAFKTGREGLAQYNLSGESHIPKYTPA